MTRFRQSGSATIEMTLVGIPIIFTLISVFEMSRGMWIYQTLAYSVKVGIRYAIVHGASCDPNLNNGINSCRVTMAQVAAEIENAGVGLDPQNTLVTFVAAPTQASPDITQCYLAAGAASPLFGTHAACSTLSSLPAVQQPPPTSPASQWPPPTSNENGVGQAVEIELNTPFRSAIAMLWPDQKTVSFAAKVPQCLDASHPSGVTCLGATSTDDIQF